MVKLNAQRLLNKYNNIKEPEILEGNIIREIDIDFIHEIPKYLTSIRITINGIQNGEIGINNLKYVNRNIKRIVSKMKKHYKYITFMKNFSDMKFDTKLLIKKTQYLQKELRLFKKENSKNTQKILQLLDEIEKLIIVDLKNELNKRRYSFLDIIEDVTSAILAEKCVIKEKLNIVFTVSHLGSEYSIHMKRFFRDDYDIIKLFLLNIVRNAFDAVEDIRNNKNNKNVKIVTNDTEEHFFIEIIDNGIGMDEQTLASFMQTRFSRKKNGTGFGITEARLKILKDKYKVKMFTESEPGKGTKIRLEFPF